MDNIFNEILKYHHNRFSVVQVLFIILFITLFVWCSNFHWKRRRLYKMAAQRRGPPTLPLIGNAHYFIGSSADTLKRITNLFKEYDLPAPAWVGGKLFYGISAPNDLEIILNSPHALDKGHLYKYVVPIAGNGLFTAPASMWKPHRKIVMQSFNQKILESFVEIFSENSAILTEQLKQESGKGIFEIFHYLSYCMVDIIVETVMGVSVNAQTSSNKYMKWVDRVMEIAFRRMSTIWYRSDLLFNMTPMAKEFKAINKELQDFTCAVVKQKKELYYRKNENAQEQSKPLFNYGAWPTLLQHLIELSAKDRFTDKEIQEEVTTTLIAGSDTAASASGFVFIVLGMFPDVQRQVYQEVINIVGRDRLIGYQDLPKLSYMERVIKETLRIFPTAPLIGREITSDIKLEKCTLPAGCSVMINFIDLHRNENIWPDPLKFDPDRFLPEEVAKRHPYSWLPFSGGPRNCIGSKFGMMEMKTLIAAAVVKYRITTDYKCIEDVEIRSDMLLKPVHGFRIGLELRKYA